MIIVAAEVEILAKNSIKISSITDTITAITYQTNLLANKFKIV